jgi:hypothetical protein
MKTQRGCGPATVFAVMGMLLGATANAQDLQHVVMDARSQIVGPAVSVVDGATEVLALLAVDGQSAALAGDALLDADFEDGEVANGARLVEVLVTSDRLRHAYAPYVYFDGDGCSGNAWLSANATAPARDLRAGIAGRERDLYVARQGGAELVPVRSLLLEASCTAFAHAVRVRPADRLVALDAIFTAPFRW